METEGSLPHSQEPVLFSLFDMHNYVPLLHIQINYVKSNHGG